MKQLNRPQGNRTAGQCCRITAYLLFLVLLSSGGYIAKAQIPKKVLFLGNSFIASNDLPGLVKAFADKAGLPFHYAAHTPGGIYVKYLPQGSAAHANNPYVYDLIRSDSWDYIVLQDNQGFFCSPTPGYFGKDSYVAEGHLQIRDSLLKKNPCGKLILFSGWLDKDPYGAYPALGLATAAAANQRIYEQYRYLNTHFTEQIIAPIGIVWNRILAEKPSVALFAADNYHPSYDGSYVTAATLFSTIFHRSAEEVLFDGGLTPAIARYIRKAAFEVVRDSLESSGMAAVTPVLTVSGISLSAAAGFSHYQWYQNDIAMPGSTTNTILFKPGNCYQLEVTDSKGCSSWSLRICDPEATTTVPVMIATNGIPSYPNPVQDILFLQAGSGLHTSISDISGQVIYSAARVPASIDMSAYPPGIYLLMITDHSGKQQVQRIIKE